MSDLLVRVSGVCGRITLNRPRALNALTLEMVSLMYTTLKAWINDASVEFVLVDGAGDRGLCAGGDIRALCMAAMANDKAFTSDFFRTEYELNYLISRYPKPYVALMDGIVMGGGIGISAHASHRIVTERSQLAMPETAIGFFPDVGGTYLLGKMPDEFGTYLGLTGNRISAADAISCDLADTMVLSKDLLHLTHQLESKSVAEVDKCLLAHAANAQPGMTATQKAWIKECFAASTVEDICNALAQHKDDQAKTTSRELAKKSPSSLKVTLAALRSSLTLGDLASCLQQEYRIARACVQKPDFIEGVQAAVIDKTHQPTWHPERLEEITPQMVQDYFVALDEDKLNLTL